MDDVRYTLVVLVLPLACSGVDRDEDGYELDARRWFAGDLHVHATGASNDTDGMSFPPAIKAKALERGLDFVVLTDHSNSTGSDATTRDEDPALFNQGPEFMLTEEAAAQSSDTFLMVSGNEISPQQSGEFPTPNGHIGCIPERLDGFDVSSAFVDRPMGTVDGASALAQAQARPCFAIVNHPFEHAPWIRYDWTSRDYDGLEVWNGGAGFDERDMEAYDAWRCDLFEGRAVTPIGASDNHQLGNEPPGNLTRPALGWPRTAVLADDLTWPSIIEALEAGRVAIYEGDTRLYVATYDSSLRVSDDDVRVLRLRGALDENVEQAVLELVRITGCEDRRARLDPPVVETETVFRRGVRAGRDFDERVEIDTPGVYTASLLSGDVHYQALSRAVFVHSK